MAGQKQLLHGCIVRPDPDEAPGPALPSHPPPPALPYPTSQRRRLRQQRWRGAAGATLPAGRGRGGRGAGAAGRHLALPCPSAAGLLRVCLLAALQSQHAGLQICVSEMYPFREPTVRFCTAAAMLQAPLLPRCKGLTTHPAPRLSLTLPSTPALPPALNPCQVALLDRLSRGARLGCVEALTVDKCQGRDKDCIVLSLVKSNTEGEAGEQERGVSCKQARWVLAC